MAYISNQLGGGAELCHSIELKVERMTSTQILPDLPGDGFCSSKEDL